MGLKGNINVPTNQSYGRAAPQLPRLNQTWLNPVAVDIADVRAADVDVRDDPLGAVDAGVAGGADDEP